MLIACGTKNVVSENKQDSTKTTGQTESSTTHVNDGDVPPLMQVTIENAKDVNTFQNTPESVVIYFFASRIRKDKEWEKVCPTPDKRTDELKRGLEEYNKWTFTKCRFVEKKEFEKNKFWVKVYMEINIDGETDNGEDEATVEFIDGKCVITDVPT